MRRLSTVLMVLLLAAPLRAENFALIIANQDYETLPDASSAGAVRGAVDALADMGFDVIEGYDIGASEMRSRLSDLHERMAAEGSERLVIVLAGHFAQSRSGAWLKGTESIQAGLSMADAQGLRLDVVLEIAALSRTAATVWLAESNEAEAFGLGIQAGLPTRLMVPQGVGVVRGRADQIVPGLRASLQPGTALAAVVDRNRHLSGEGTIPALIPFLPAGFAPAARADLRAFAVAQEAGSEDAYLAYLESFPNGQNAQAARAALERIRTAPDRMEEGLVLTRGERRAIQRDLTLLGYDTRGVDGIFGPGTRASIALWQDQNEMESTGFLTRDQIFRLTAQGAERSARVEAEERARREVQERDDRDFWAATGAAADEPGLRSYLERYPEGIFAALARERLSVMEDAARRVERERDQAAWAEARRFDTLEGYEAYLRNWPEGEHAEEARARVTDASPGTDAAPDEGVEDDAARAAEEALGLSPATRQLIEQRLARLGHDPGTADGSFDSETRGAIRQAQARFDLRQTGYVNQDLVTALITSLMQGIFD